MKTKVCPRCGVEKSLDQFGKRRKNKSWARSYCKTCQNKETKDWIRKNPEKHKQLRKRAIANRRENVAGWSEAQYQHALKTQEGRCALCGTHEIFLKKALNADHCHVTGAKRGLLCDRCNSGIGFLQDDPEILRKAAAYLEKYK
jgi:hypothetical protein